MISSSSTLKVLSIVISLSVVHSKPLYNRILDELPATASGKSCDNAFLQKFILKPELRNSEPPKGEIERLCPNVKQTCCSVTDFNDLLQQTLQKQFLLGKTKASIVDLINWIVALSDQEVNEIVQVVHQKNCVRPQNIPLLVARSELKRNNSAIFENLQKSHNYFLRLSTGFTCSLCEQENLSQFQSAESGEGFVVKVNKNYCDMLFVQGMEQGVLEVFHNLAYLNVFVEMLGCMANEQLTLRPVLYKSEYNNLQEKGLYCSTNNNWVTDPECSKVCREFPVINRNVFADYMVPIEKSKIYFANLITEYHNSKDKLIQSTGQQLVNKIQLDRDQVNILVNTNYEYNLPTYLPKFDYFVEAIGGEKTTQKLINVALVEQDGLVLRDWEMELVATAVSRTLSAIITCLALIFLTSAQ